MMKLTLACALLLLFVQAAGAREQAAQLPSSDPAASVSNPSKLTVDSTMGELLDNPAARAVLERHVPVLVASPQIAQARGMSLRSIQAYAPTLLTDERLHTINDALARAPGAIASETPPPQQTPLPHDTRVVLDLSTVRLWEGRAPLATGDGPSDIPTLTIVGTDGAVSYGTAVIVAPGGGYQTLATGHEGRQIADWFAAHGVMAFVLRYRLASAGYRHPTQLTDAKRAICWVRANAARFGVSPQRIGMIGFSAGGHLTAMASTAFDAGDPSSADPVERVSSKLDFAVLVYGATSIDGQGWQAPQLVDPRADKATLDQLSPTRHVSGHTPPTFLLHTSTDAVVPPDHALAYYGALRAAKVPVEMHIFENGAHGLGFSMGDAVLAMGPVLLENWLRAHRLLGRDVE